MVTFWCVVQCRDKTERASYPPPSPLTHTHSVHLALYLPSPAYQLTSPHHLPPALSITLYTACFYFYRFGDHITNPFKYFQVHVIVMRVCVCVCVCASVVVCVCEWGGMSVVCMFVWERLVRGVSCLWVGVFVWWLEGVLVSVWVCTYMFMRIRLFVILILYFVCEESWTFCRPRRTSSIRLAIKYVYNIYYYMCYMRVYIIGPYVHSTLLT